MDVNTSMIEVENRSEHTAGESYSREGIQQGKQHKTEQGRHTAGRQTGRRRFSAYLVCTEEERQHGLSSDIAST